MRRFALGVVMAVTIALPARAQDAHGSLPARLSLAARDTIARLVDSAHTRHLPAELLVAKAREGVLKGADDARVVRAVRSLLKELETARAALPATASHATIAAGASALHAGVTAEGLRKLAAARPGSLHDQSGLATALITLADLVANAVPAHLAASSVEQLLRRGTPDAEMSEFRAAVTQDIQSGRAPEAALSVRTRALTRP